MERYVSFVEQDGLFLAGYHRGQAVCTEKEYLSAHLRIVRVVQGQGQWRIGRRLYDVQAGDLLLFNNITPRQIVSVTEPPLVYELIGFSYQACSFVPRELLLFYHKEGDGYPLLSHTAFDLSQIYGVLDLLKVRFASKTPNVAVVTGLIRVVCEMLLELLPQISGDKGADPSALCAYTTLGNALRYMEQHLETIQNVSEIASHLYLSRGYFHRLFLKYTGATPSHFLNRCRVARFLYYMAQGNKTVLEAALQSGFSSSSGFYQTFHAVCGTTPTEYLSNFAP